VGEDEDRALLQRGLREEEIGRRGAAAAALGALGRRGLLAGHPLPELVAALADPAWQVRAAAARAFSDLARGGAFPEERAGGGDVARTLRAALGDPEPAVRSAAIEALGAGGRTEHAGAIAALAGDPSTPAPVAVAALRALVVLGAASLEVVGRAASHPDPEVLKEAVLAAARIPGEDGARILREAAASPRWDVRQAAARAMSERGDRSLGAEAALLAGSDPDPLVARAFAEAARSLGAR